MVKLLVNTHKLMYDYGNRHLLQIYVQIFTLCVNGLYTWTMAKLSIMYNYIIMVVWSNFHAVLISEVSTFQG